MSLCLSLVQRSKCTAYSEFLLLFVFDGCCRSQVLLMGWKLKPECYVVWFWIHVINLASITILNVTVHSSPEMNSAVGEHDGCSWPFWWFARPCYVCFFRYVLRLSQPLRLTWCSMKQSIWENGCWRWRIIRIYLPSIIYDLWVAQFALETSSFLMMYWVFIYFFLLYTVHAQAKRMADIIEIFYSTPCSRPLVDKDHVPIKIFSQEKIMDDIQREW